MISPHVKPENYKEILMTLMENMTNITFMDSKNNLKIKKKDMIFEVTHQGEMIEIVDLMWKINNFICRQYRRRKHILKSTVITDA